jgi:hypothetical protein
VGIDLIDVVQDLDRWRDLVDAAMKLRVSKNGGGGIL